MDNATEKMAPRHRRKPLNAAIHIAGKWMLAALLALGFLPSARAQQSIWTNPITNANPSATNPFTSGDVFDTNLTVSGIGAGSGVTANAGSNRFNFSSWNSPALSPDDYFSWTLTPASSFAIDFASLTGNWQRSGTGANTYSLQYSTDGATFSELLTGAVTGSGNAVAFNLDLSNPVLDAISAPVTFRLYGWGGSAAAGTFSINDFAFNGVVIPATTGGSSLYWTADGTTLGGSGTWGATTPAQWSASDTTIAAVNFDSTKNAVFKGIGGTVTVDGGGITVEPAAGASLQFDATGYTIAGGPITLNATSAIISVTNAGDTTTINAPLASGANNTGGVSKVGSGELVLGAANTFTGGINVAAGTLSISADDQLGDVNNDITLGGTLKSTAANLMLDAGRDLTGSGKIDVATGNTLTVQGSVNAAAPTLSSGGTVVLAGGKNLTGLTFSSTGTLKSGVNGDENVTIAGPIKSDTTTGTAKIQGNVDFGDVSANRTITVADGGQLVVTGNLSNGHFITVSGTGTLELQGDNSGVSSFTLGTASALGATLKVHKGTGLGNAGTFIWNSGTLEAAEPLTGENAVGAGIGPSVGAVDSFPAIINGAAIEFNAPFRFFRTSGTHQEHLTVNNTTTAAGGWAVSGPATGGGVSTGVTIDGTGKFIAAGSITHELPITVDTATLEINGTMSAPTATINVINGGTLQGIGSTQGVTIGAGATLSPGSGNIGTLSVDSAAIGGKLKVELNQADPAKNDVLNVTNALTLSSAEVNFSTMGSLTDSAFVFAHYGSLTGNPFSTISGLPTGYTIDYNYQNSNALALILATGILHGDWDRNGIINAADIPTMLKGLTDLAAYKTQYNVTRDQDLATIGDFNSSGTITNADIQGLLDLVATQPGGGSISAVPEPSAILTGLFGFIGCAGFVRTRRARTCLKNS